ncbi:hypothetical protein VN23_10350 [Janthinobacterium sp. B9-8]|nr:hypothetical protein VN23_10350 [Janthinobacterium sp. B9-8]
MVFFLTAFIFYATKNMKNNSFMLSFQVNLLLIAIDLLLCFIFLFVVCGIFLVFVLLICNVKIVNCRMLNKSEIYPPQTFAC